MLFGVGIGGAYVGSFGRHRAARQIGGVCRHVGEQIESKQQIECRSVVVGAVATAHLVHDGGGVARPESFDNSFHCVQSALANGTRLVKLVNNNYVDCSSFSFVIG